ncbi:MAG: ribosome biogenesis GTP-binding protein YihA/YsxC [Melioribacteraceae bacterium]|nr:ribosome biogenesis GTP-binding protein YihA/YsxC [Melioribacteraceae bacterium]MCF8264611.1 ribosome biogenesis GTP-binding protein YihA/YsxC [Melioribacteraceae bacterium]MCF8414458.1 ribosome biogenesis GTP-binding protein YihA/YsxC [Melioribacteraceae bacterium]
MKAEFKKSVFKMKDLPSDNLPEVILCGRSNVGKSSFINTLFNAKNLAKTSSTPGKTRSLNYYLVDDKFYLVDLPGFGYAKVSKKERDGWQRLITTFLQDRDQIVEAYHLIDSRHNPMELDYMLHEFLMKSGIVTTIILSKVDKLKQAEKSKAAKSIQGIFENYSLNENLFFFSSVKGIGKKQVLTKLTTYL